MTNLMILFFFLILGAIIYLLIFIASYNDSCMMMWLCRNAHLLQYKGYDAMQRRFKFCATDGNGIEILTVELNKDLDIFVDDNVSQDYFFSQSAACLITNYMLRKRLLSMIPREDMENFINSTSFKNRLK